MIRRPLLWNKRIRPAAAKSAHDRKCRARTSAAAIEPLESRIAPAAFTGNGTALTINLTSAGEVVTFHTDGTTITAALTGGTAGGPGGPGITLSGTTATITSTDYATISVTDSVPGESVAFADSGSNPYPQAFTINLSQTGSGNITFTGASTFNASFSGTTTSGFISSDPASSVNVGMSSNLALSAAGHDILMSGAVVVAGTTSLTGGVIEVHNTGNNFTGALQITGPSSGSIFTSGPLNLGASTFAVASASETVTIAAGGAITQSGAFTATGTGTLAFASTGGSITLTTGGNSVGANLGLSLTAAGANTASYTGTGALELANVQMGSGLLSLTASGAISQKTGTTILSGGAINAEVTTNNQNILLGNAGNNITGLVTALEGTANDLRDFSLRNANENAQLPAGTPFTTAGDIRNLTLYFDNTGINLPGYDITGNLMVTAGGNINQSAALTLSGGPSTATATVLGDFAIELANPANAFSGTVSLEAPHSTHSVGIENATGLTFGNSSLGRGAFSATAVTGNITQTGAGSFLQEKGAPPATFTVSAGNSITLNSAGNDFTGDLVFASGVALLSVRNADYQASFSELSIPSSVTDLTVQFDNAPIDLPTLNLTNLTVTAQGIVQQSGSSLSVSNAASFTANAFPINLPNAGNAFEGVNLSNTGRNDVTVNSNGGIALGNTNVGSGHLTINVGGNLTGGISQTTSGEPVAGVSLTSTGGLVDVTGSYLGPVSISVTGANTASITDDNALILGVIKTGSGSFSAATTSGSISQDPNSVLSLTGAASFTAGAGGSLTLNNQTNAFTGAASFSATNASIASAGAIVFGTSTLGGTLTVSCGSISQTGPITVTGAASFNAGASSINLTNSSNAFSSVSLFSTGGGATVSLIDINPLSVGTILLGGGTLYLQAGGDITTASGGSIVETAGGGAITLSTPTGSNITLNASGNELLGTVDIVGSNNVSVSSHGNLTFFPNSTITGQLTATSGGALTLPNNLTGLSGLTTSAITTIVSSDIMTSLSGISMSGNVDLLESLILSSGAGFTFNGNVSVGGALTLDAATNSTIAINTGDFNLGPNTLTINGTNVALQIGTGSGSMPASLEAISNVAATTISMPGNGNVTVQSTGTLSVGASEAADVVTLANGTGSLIINGSLGVGLGAVNGELLKTGAGMVKLGTNAELAGSGLAGSSATPVLVSQTALLTGFFANSLDATGAPHDFFAGSDIVTPNYSPTSLSVQAGGLASTTGTATGFLPDGDTYTVKSSLGAASELATTVDLAGHLDIVVRDSSTTTASSLSITTTGGGNSLLSIGGVAIHNPGAVTVTAPAGNFIDSLTTAGALTSLTGHDLIGASAVDPFLLTTGGAASAATSVTAHDVQYATFDLADSLAIFKSVAVGSFVSITAQKFGAISTTGDRLGSTAVVPGSPDPGSFDATLISTETLPGVVVGSVTISGTLSGVWDLSGSIGKVTASTTSSWTLGTVAAANDHNGGMLTNATSLSLGEATNVSINATGLIASLNTFDLTGALIAGSFGAIKAASDAALGYYGTVDGTIEATGNTAGFAVKNLSADALDSLSLVLLNGSAGSINVTQEVLNSTFTASGALGNLGSITAGDWQSGNISAQTIGTFNIIGDAKVGVLANFSASTITVLSNSGGSGHLGLGTFSVLQNVTSSIFNIENGNMGAFKVGQELGSTTVNLTNPAFGALASIAADEWLSGVSVTAKTIGLISSTAPTVTVQTGEILNGDLSGSIYAYENSGSTPAIGTVSATGSFTGTLDAPHGIGSLTVRQAISSSFIIADDSLVGAPNVGNIAKLTAGSVSNTLFSVNTLGAFATLGYSQISGGAEAGFGNVSNSTFLVKGATAKSPTSISSFTVSGEILASTIVAPFGIKTLTVSESIAVSGGVASEIITNNAANPVAGIIGSLTAGDLQSSIVDAGSIGTLTAKGNAAAGILGDINGSTIAITSGATVAGAPQALGTLTVAGDFDNSVLDAPDSVAKIQVAGRVTSLTTETKIEAGYATSAKIGSLIAGAWGQAGNALTTDLVTQNIASITLTGNSHRGFVGTTDEGFIDILGNAAGVGLGAFSATGAATNTLFRVSAGNVNTFTVERMVSSALLVGFTFVTADDITATATSADWASASYKLGAFTTTAPYSSTDVADSASFVDSDVIAAILGKITLSGVNPATSEAATFGVAFRTSAGATAEGVVKTDGSATALAPGATGQFDYLGLAG